ncbi:MAG: geranylgeranylglycerol-phosphate geranylgeranyltransferase [Bacteroidales bacterium]|nr:geranylgeranylglycerol-phosphate geranylgeranyltransferase [Bacteroidales bacterium]MCF8343464.1 geranylgeranylglycerol-phosphate geranylgeranyltransferase [Bacteroidales bacterium]MCF8352279.1 geranylgeranylglycerol-phosphate geranylgeranyltransferase [Bacteroidales bacterium]MCF8375670.1 geranylgeranylglycerol-phosphate geranylgeranyltransferase [Bacteroidales bacterium]MCF8401468.1 geranylgeranylglycerol-phosphate geranylgeranyltransferase [Bacteroidales bacterium]
MPLILKMLRLPNLLIVILSQILIRYYIILPYLQRMELQPALQTSDFLLLVLATVLITAAGYFINDYFDVEADRINKPKKYLVGRDISRGLVMIMYYALNTAAIAIGIYLAFRLESFQVALIFPLVIIMLWYYSSKYKRSMLWGNIVVAILSGFVIYIVWLFEVFGMIRGGGELSINSIEIFNTLRWFIWGFTFFAFYTTLIREIMKDTEDMAGDAKTGARTLPLFIGVKNTRAILFVLGLIGMAILAYAQYLLSLKGFILAFWYLLFSVQILLIVNLILLVRAKESRNFHLPGTLMKVIMLAGIISMQFIYFDL